MTNFVLAATRKEDGCITFGRVNDHGRIAWRAGLYVGGTQEQEGSGLYSIEHATRFDEAHALTVLINATSRIGPASWLSDARLMVAPEDRPAAPTDGRGYELTDAQERAIERRALGGEG